MKRLIILLCLVPAVVFAQNRTRKAAAEGPERYQVIQAQGGSYMVDSYAGRMWLLTKDKSGAAVLAEVIKEDATVKSLKAKVDSLKKAGVASKGKLEDQVKVAENLTKAGKLLKAEKDSLADVIAADTTASIREVWKSPFYMNASATQQGMIDSLIINNSAVFTPQTLKGLKSKVKAKEMQKIDQTVEKRIIAVIEKYYQFKKEEKK